MVKANASPRIWVFDSEANQYFDYCKKSGNIIWKISPSKRVSKGDIAGTLDKKTGYIRIWIKGKRIQAHTLAWYLITGEWVKDLDHKDGNRSNNIWTNLRKSNRVLQSGNWRTQKRNTSGFRGVCWHKRDLKWVASIRKNGKLYHLGYFHTKKEAKIKYNQAAKEYFGDHYRCLYM